MNHYIVYAIIAVGIFTAYMAIVNAFRSDRLRHHVKNMAGAGYETVEEYEEKLPPFAIFCDRLLGAMGTDVKAQPELTLELARAGIYAPQAISYYLFFKRIIQPVLLVLGAIFLVKTLLISGVPLSKRFMHGIIALLFVVAGMGGAKLYINNRKKHRQAVLLRSFPEVLDLLLVCIESGLGLDAALSRCCKELKNSHPVITQELERTRLELTMMSDRSQALHNLAERTEIIPFKSLVSALIQTEKFGTSLVDTLRVLSDEQRTTRLFNAENKAARIPVLITIPLVLCILPAFIMIILGPPIVKVINQGGIFGDEKR